MKNEVLKNLVAMNIVSFWKNNDIEMLKIAIDVIYSNNDLEIKIFDCTDIDNSITLKISKVIKPKGMCNYCNMSMLEFTEVVNKYGLTEEKEKGDA